MSHILLIIFVNIQSNQERTFQIMTIIEKNLSLVKFNSFNTSFIFEFYHRRFSFSNINYKTNYSNNVSLII